jgi:hypothetical protein
VIVNTEGLLSESFFDDVDQLRPDEHFLIAFL